MLFNSTKYVSTILILLFSLNVYSKSSNVIKLSCEYDPNLIKQELKDIGFLRNDEIDNSKICKFLNCKDVVEVIKSETQSNGEEEFRLRNSWFNHQGILIDDFLLSEDNIKISTFVSQAYFLESYTIDRVTGKTQRAFYRFNYPEFFSDVQKLEKSSSRKIPLFNDKGKISLKTLEILALKPYEVFYFEGVCYEGTNI